MEQARAWRRPAAPEPTVTVHPAPAAPVAGVRMDRVAAARERLASGFYDDPAVLDAAAERMLAALDG